MNVGFRLNIDPNCIPVFYVNKNIWNEDYQKLIKQHTYTHTVCIVVDARKELNLPNRYAEFTFTSPYDFDKYKEEIEKLL